MSEYGPEFDLIAEQWRVLENLHDELHPDRNVCGGVCGCSMMAVAVDLQERMIRGLIEWRARNPS